MSRIAILAAWTDVPHITEENQAAMLSAYMPHERDARSKGVPQLGAGAIYPVPEEDILCKPFEIPAWYRLAYGLDVGWKRTAAIWGAVNPETDVLYLFHEYYRGQAEPAVHAQALKSPGNWIPGVCDPAARGRSQIDGQQLMTIYQGLGLLISPADNAVESGIYDLWSRMSSGRLKVFDTLENWKTEFRIYRRDDKGKVVKDLDHLMDATRYLNKSGVARARQKPYSDWAPLRAKTHHTFDYDPMAEAYKILQPFSEAPMIKAAAKKPKSFESTLEDEPIHNKIREELLKSRKHPEVVYLKNKAEASNVEAVLTALHGLRGQRIPVLIDPDLHSSFEIKWGV